jgi:hypothetical protein
MKKLLAILVLGLLWCNVGFAQVIKYECTSSKFPTLDYINYQIDIDNKSATTEWMLDGEFYSDTYTILSVDSEKVLLKSNKDSKEWYFNYATNQTVYYPKENLTTPYNCRYDKNLVKSSKDKSEKIEIASMIDKAKNTCKELGFEEGTEKFADCGLKLYSQSVELAAKNNQQIVMQPQSSGSNVMTIYDPRRDSRILINQGQRMLSGACTLGINC